MLLETKAGPYTVRGISLGGVHTSLAVPELGVLFDAGFPSRAFAGIDHVFLSHGHADHIGSLGALLGIRGLHGKPPPRLYFPAAIEEPLLDALRALTKMQRFDLAIDAVPMRDGERVEVSKGLYATAFKTHHPVPSLGYALSRRVSKLREEFAGLPGQEIAARRRAGEDLFRVEERIELAYATDTLARVLETAPMLLDARVLILECTFLDDKKSRDASRAGCHIHLDDLIEMAPEFRNEHVVLMHFSQLYKPRDVHRILAERVPPCLEGRYLAFAPKKGPWPL